MAQCYLLDTWHPLTPRRPVFCLSADSLRSRHRSRKGSPSSPLLTRPASWTETCRTERGLTNPSCGWGTLQVGMLVVGPWCFPRQCCSAALFSCPAVLSVAWHLTRQHDTRLILLFVVVRRRHVGSEPAKLDFPNLPASAPPHSIQHNSQLTLILYGTGATTASFSSTRSDRLSASTLLTLSRR